MCQNHIDPTPSGADPVANPNSGLKNMGTSGGNVLLFYTPDHFKGWLEQPGIWEELCCSHVFLLGFLLGSETVNHTVLSASDRPNPSCPKKVQELVITGLSNSVHSLMNTLWYKLILISPPDRTSF